MSKDLIIAILALAFAGCCGALLVVLAKLDEQKQMTADEHDNYCVALRIGNTNAKMLGESQERERCSAQAVLWYSEKLKSLKEDRNTLQDKLSAVICPANNHVWKDGCCVKCGRMKDALS